MKKTLIILAVIGLIFITHRAWCQTPTPANKKVYQPDLSAKLPFTVNVTAGQANAYFYVLQKGGPEVLSQSKELSAFDVKQYLTVYSTVIDSVNSASFKAFQAFYKAGEAKWALDTLKAFKAIKKQ